MLAASESNLPQPQHFLTPKSLVYVINSKLCCRGFVPKFKRRQEKLDRLKGRMCDEKLKHSYFQSFKKADCFFSSFSLFFCLFLPARVRRKKGSVFDTWFHSNFFSRIRSSSLSSWRRHTRLSHSVCMRVWVGVRVCWHACERVCVRVSVRVSLCVFYANTRTEKIEPVKKDEKNLGIFWVWYTCPPSQVCISLSLIELSVCLTQKYSFAFLLLWFLILHFLIVASSVPLSLCVHRQTTMGRGRGKKIFFFSFSFSFSVLNIIDRL